MLNYLDYFEFNKNKKEKITKKVDYFLKCRKEKIHLVLDFDRTLTKSQSQFGENISTWHVLKNHLPEKAKQDYENLYNKYRPLEIAGIMKLSDAITWWNEILNLYKKNNLSWIDIANDVDKKMPMRDGVKEIFEICQAKNIPIMIISAGIKDVIEIWCKKYKIKPSIILSTKLFFDDNGVINGWDKKSLVHVLNKKEIGHNEVAQIRKTRPNTILVGDSIDDYSMVSGEKNVLRVIVDDARLDDKPTNGVDNKKLEKFDLIIKNKSLFPVAEIIKLF